MKTMTVAMAAKANLMMSAMTTESLAIPSRMVCRGGDNYSSGQPPVRSIRGTIAPPQKLDLVPRAELVLIHHVFPISSRVRAGES